MDLHIVQGFCFLTGLTHTPVCPRRTRNAGRPKVGYSFTHMQFSSRTVRMQPQIIQAILQGHILFATAPPAKTRRSFADSPDSPESDLDQDEVGVKECSKQRHT